jgi:Transposase and inactivated derivatives
MKMTRTELAETVHQDVETRIREGVKAVIEQILEEEMTAHIGAARRERSPVRRDERNGHYQRDLITPVGKVEQLRVPRARQGEFLTEVFDRYQRMTGNVEEAVLEMYLQGVSTRKVAAITDALSGVRVGKDAVSRIAARLDDELREWRARPLSLAYAYLYMDAVYLKVNWSGSVTDLALLVAIGVNEQGFREVLAVEAAGAERKEAYRNLLKGLIDRGLRGVQLVISDDHESIKQAVKIELPGTSWQRCTVHFMRNVLSGVPASDMAEVGADLKQIFKVSRSSSARGMADEFVERYQKKYIKAIEVFKRGIEDALCYMRFPGSHHNFIRTTNGLERLFREVKRRTRVVGVFPGEKSAVSLSTTVMLRATEDWALRRYMDMEPLKALNSNPQL